MNELLTHISNRKDPRNATRTNDTIRGDKSEGTGERKKTKKIPR